MPRKVKWDFKSRFKLFISMIQINDNLCWVWKGSTDKDTGYGQFRAENKKLYKAHRFSAYVFYGLPLNEKRLVAMHKCDTRNCVNPAHIKVGTQSENLLDSVRKGRWHTGGGRNPNFVNHLKQKDWGKHKEIN